MKLSRQNKVIAGALVAIVAAVLGLDQLNGPGVTEPNLPVDWSGWPVVAREYSGIDPGIYPEGPPPEGYVITSREIGFREDGVVVWRDAKEPNVPTQRQ